MCRICRRQLLVLLRRQVRPGDAGSPEDHSRSLLVFGLTMIVAAPLAAVLLFVLPSQLG